MPDDPSQENSLSRRRLLTAGGIGLAIGVVGTEVGNLVAGSSPAPSTTTPPDVDLMQEHGILKRVLLIYEASNDRIASGQPAPMAAIHEGAVIIHDFIEGFHEAMEEGYVFPMLARRGEARVDYVLLCLPPAPLQCWRCATSLGYSGEDASGNYRMTDGNSGS